METPSNNLAFSNNTGHNNPPFLHTALTYPTLQIRLLTLYPSAWQPTAVGPNHFISDFARPIHCSIQHVYINEPPPYNALSYCWGENRLTHTVNIDGAALPITESLDSAIRHLRHSTESVVTWIDQICINQSDDYEKSDQVKMMARIYSKAEQVLIWLGPAGQGSDDAMDLYTQVGNAIWMFGLQNYCNRDMMPLLDAAIHDKNPGDQLWQQVNIVQSLARRLLLPSLQAMVDWDRCPWFGRVWVVQEFCFAVNPLFVCGNKRIPVDYVKTTRLLLGLRQTHEFVRSVQELGDDKTRLLQTINSDDPMPSLFSTRIWRQKYNCGEGPGNTLLELLCKTFVSRNARATKPVDRVFSLVGIATDADRLGIHIDYKKTAVQVLTGFAKAIIEKGNLAVLAYVQFPRDVASLPSWAPDWHSNLRPSFYPYPTSSLEHDHYFNPSGGRPPVITPGLPDAVLGLGGFVVDTVEDIGSILTDDGSHADPLRYQSYLTQIRFLCRLSAVKNQPIYASRQRRDEAEWRVPIADIWEANEPGPGARQRATDRAMRAFAELRGILAWFESGGLGPAVAPEDREPSMYRLSIAKMHGMRPFITNQGYVGVGPPAMLPGDVAVILFGARVCSILRPRGMWAYMAKQYLYIGEAYCDGVMDGELLGQRWEEVFYMV